MDRSLCQTRRVGRSSSRRGPIIGLLCVVVAASLVVPGTAHAQSQLVPLVTDQGSLALANRFGMPGGSAVNQRGDYAFGGAGEGALFFRPANASTPVRVFQAKDEIPGLPGTLADLIYFYSNTMNASGVLAFRVDFAQPNGALQGAILTFDGTTVRRLVTGLDAAPVTPAARFERGLSLGGINNNGDIAFTATLVPAGSNLPARPTLFICPAGGAPVRVAGLGDTAPDSGGATFTTFGSLGALNNRGEVLLSATVAGGPSTPGLFVASTAGVRKIVAPGDLTPDGTATFGSISGSLMNNAGQVAFYANQSAPLGVSAIWISSPSTGLSRIVKTGDVSPLGGTFSQLWSTSALALNDGGAVAFVFTLAGVPGISMGLFRVLPAQPVTVVAQHRQPAPGSAGQIFTGIGSAISMNGSGTISFRATLSGFGVPTTYGLYQREVGSAPLTVLALDGQATPLPTGTYSLSSTNITRTLDTGEVFFSADVLGGAADYGEFLLHAGSAKVLMNTADTLPPGASVVLRTFRPSGAGDFVGFSGRRAGGSLGMFIHDIANRTTSLVASEGDPVLGGRLRGINPTTVVPVNAGGGVAVQAQVVTSNGVIGALFLWKAGSLTKIVAQGDAMPPGTGTTFQSVKSAIYMPSPLNDADQILFSGTSASGSTGLFVGSTSGIQKVVIPGQTAPDGHYTFSTTGSGSAPINATAAINASGQVVFKTNIVNPMSPQDSRTGIFIFTPGASPEIVEVCEAGGPAPWSGITLGNLGTPSLNNLGEIAFMAQLVGGPDGAVFFRSAGAAGVLTPVAVGGNAAPAGGTYSFPRAWYDLQLNDRSDLVFRADLVGGVANSGIFLRRGTTGLVEKVVLQGEPAPGTDGAVFYSIPPSLNQVVGEYIQMDPDAHIAFMAYYQRGQDLVVGNWHVKPDGTVEPILVRGTVAPEFGGGVAAYSSASISWNSNARYAMKVRVSGSTFVDGIFLFVPPQPAATPTGTNVVVQPTDETTGQPAATLTFGAVTAPGGTTLTTSAGGPAVPTSFQLGDPPLFYNLSTTATFTGTIQVCVVFDPARFPDVSGLRLLHYEGGVWRDVTIGGGPSGNTICGQVTSLSPFAVAKDVVPPTITAAVTPSVIWPANNKLVTVTANITVSDPGDRAPAVTLMSITSNEPAAPGDIQAAFGTDCRTFQLRASRLSSGSGRVYTITYRATDAAGLWRETVVRVTVPHDQGR